MSNFFQRLADRWQTARRYAGAADRWTDRLSLFLAGVARQRPFAGPSLYARIGRGLGAHVAPRIRAAAGQRLAFDLCDVTDLMIFEEIFLDAIYPLNRVPFTPDTVVDCGACAGHFTVFAHGRYPNAHLHAFEPNPLNLGRLHRNLALNAISATVHAAAVAAESGQARFNGEGFGGHLAEAGEAASIDVRLVALPGFLQGLSTRHLLLKIDIEGAEQLLLPRLTVVLPTATVLFLETHHPEPVWREYIQPLLAAGFRHELIRHRHDPVVGTDYDEHILLRC